MRFVPLKLADAFVVELEKMGDERGYFARSWCVREFAEHGLDSNLVQCNVSFNRHRGTLRGMHYQLPPWSEGKLVRCTRGKMLDVIVDIRPDSPTFLEWTGEELTPENGRMMFVPKGFAHGFITLADDTEVFYQMTEFYDPGSARGVRWDDPLFGITWPERPRVMSPKDEGYPPATREGFAPLHSSKLNLRWES
jgi:dTDP-4-dehydrorhamnose 3,5-epimerase